MSWLDKALSKIGLAPPSPSYPQEERRKQARRSSDKPQTRMKSIWEHSLDEIATPRPPTAEKEKPQGLRSPGPTKVWYDLWLKELIRLVASEKVTEKEAATPELISQSTKSMIVTIFDALNTLISEFNEAAGVAALKVTVTEPHKAQNFYRFRISTGTWSLTARGQTGTIEFFLLPAGELINIYENETSRRLRATLHLNTQTSPSFWSVNGMPLDVHESRVLIRNLFKDLVLKSSSELQSSTQSLTPAVDLSGDKMSQILHDLAMEKQNLVQKIVIQQEEVQKRIARDLHDTVISDVMMLKRSLTEQSMNKDKVVDTLDSINGKLREICHDLAPRDLIDWGLQPVIEDLLQKVAEQTGADCSFSCDCQLPELSESVQLHIFRIIQECLNNAVKYSDASRIQVRVDRIPGQLSFIIEDNGKGFSQDENSEPQSTKEGGFGLGGMHERIDLIRCFYPARLAIESQPGAGTRASIILAIS